MSLFIQWVVMPDYILLVSTETATQQESRSKKERKKKK